MPMNHRSLSSSSFSFSFTFLVIAILININTFLMQVHRTSALLGANMNVRVTRALFGKGGSGYGSSISSSSNSRGYPRVSLLSRWMSNKDAGSPDSGSKIAVNFITNIIEEDKASNRNGGRMVTRFPPEPNGYLHLGHAKSINFNFGVARAYQGVTNMRMDDTNPEKEDIEYVKSILEDVKWLVTGSTGDDVAAPWEGNVRHASDYFPVIYEAAEHLINTGVAYVDSLTPEEMRTYRGTLTEPGKNSPYRDRSIEENLQLFRSMRSGHFPDSRCVLRAKIDMTSSNMNLRDPALYRIKRAPHPMTRDKWCIYPMYDFAHAISDALEGITHSLYRQRIRVIECIR